MNLKDALDFSERAHEGQFDKGGFKYFHHIERVVANTRKNISIFLPSLHAIELEEILIAAALHDVIEDCEGVNLDVLEELSVPSRSLEIIRLLSRNLHPGVTYMEGIRLIVDSGNLGAMIVKLSDNEDNSDPARIALLPEKQRGIIKRYERSKKEIRFGIEKYLRS